MISYKYNIYHSKKTKYLDKMLRECCFVWNHALALQRRYYKLFGKYISVGKMKKHFTKRIKRNLLHSQTTQEILERLDESYNRFFKKLAKRPPKFKSPEKFNSFVFKQGGFTLNGNCLTINKGKKRFRFSHSRVYEGNVKQIRIVRETCSRFSLIIVTGHNHSNSYRKTHNGASIGLDFGLKTYLTKSDGSKIDSPLFFKQYQNKKPVDVGEVSDGYHTFNELYRYSMLYNAAFFNLLARSGQVEVCKSRRHSDGEKCFGSDDWFIVMAILPTGQVSNHYESKYWDLFDVPERETAFEYDGHTPNEASDRLKKYLKLPRRGMTFEQALERLKLGRKIKRIDWGKKYICMFDVNILMVDTGQKVASNWNPTEHDIMSNDWEIAG